MPHDANTFSACGEMMSRWQKVFWMKLALQPVADQSPISRRLVAEDFIVKVFHEIGRRLIGDRSATVRRLVGDCTATSRKPLQLVGDRNQSRLVFCACGD